MNVFWSVLQHPTTVSSLASMASIQRECPLVPSVIVPTLVPESPFLAELRERSHFPVSSFLRLRRRSPLGFHSFLLWTNSNSTTHKVLMKPANTLLHKLRARFAFTTQIVNVVLFRLCLLLSRAFRQRRLRSLL